MLSIRELKNLMDKQNYTPVELAILHDEVIPTERQKNELINKTLRLEDVEYMLKLLEYDF